MKTVISMTAAISLIASAGAASAADWTGFHAGFNVGYAGDEFKYPVAAEFGSLDVRGELSLNSSGFIGGGQLGYDRQFSNRLVLGVEADFDISNVTGEVGVNGGLTGGVSGSLSANAGSELESLATIRARLGYAVSDSLLPYVTVGAAYGDVDTGYDLSIVDGGGATVFASNGSESSSQSGWAAGVGVEYKITDRISLKTEYLYSDLGDYRVLDISALGGSGSLDADTTVHAVRFGMNYLFD